MSMFTKFAGCVLARASLLLFAFTVSVLDFSAAPSTAADPAAPSVVKIVTTAGKHSLTRDGKPYFIKGVGGDGSLELLAKTGGNSVRTWASDDVGPLLDAAHKQGISVTIGIWLGHERHGFNYNDADQVAQQVEKVSTAVQTYKNHPALLMWGLGNEMEGYAQGDNAAIWSHINNLAALVKQLDPNHPTMTVVAEIGGNRVKNIHRLCPEVDIVGINTYGGGATIGQRYAEAGGTKPFVLTEYGPAGMWEVGKTSWGAPIEITSTQKAAAYQKTYQEGILGSPGKCLGSYAFIWGFKQEATATWFGMLLPTGERLAAVDALSQLWTGKAAANLAPRIDKLELVGENQLEPGTKIQVKLAVSDPEKDILKVKWLLVQEAQSYGTGGDAEAATPEFAAAIAASSETQATIILPPDGGGYRVYAYVYDGQGGAAVGNVPLLVKGAVKIPEAKKPKLPLVVYAEGGAKQTPYFPTGWMGNTAAMKLDELCKVNPHTGETCLKVNYNEEKGWGGIVWQHPASDWGNAPGGWNLTGAKRLSFWARGEKGSETVSFELGLLGSDKKFFDTGKAKLADVKLTTEWKQYSLDLAGQDLSRIKSGFVLTFPGDHGPQTLYIDDVQYE